ncbi:nuclear transport factor 2 family protein [Gordonia sp. HY002]|uniref:nuclear transport factor 2 family protein n=1 Tax=Gordonia zhenghanii TaxID=2911516 RepID=UPI001EEFA25F|nr:nuclear transport factor 2 family protein [Gordonia zhenghanii]MCF8570199.1 nuclear transport factor 2 family protein [Gordonia zhenghanii]MCF8608383.1 nuclear transport factor 2 family protein [Gordonia zhenghanii]
MRDLSAWVRARTGVSESAVSESAVSERGAPDAAASRESLRDLAVLYAMAVDAHDLDALAVMFHPDMVLERDGETASGRDAVLELLAASMRGFRRMLHTPETHVVHVDGQKGEGIATAHAELVTGRGVVLAAHEYEDAYVVHDGRWVFASRRIRFVYAARSDRYGEILPADDRVQLPGDEPRAMLGSWFTG